MLWQHWFGVSRGVTGVIVGLAAATVYAIVGRVSPRIMRTLRYERRTMSIEAITTESFESILVD
jgi:hypothetical protein